MTHLVVLDNEAVQALRDPTHSKHRRAISHAQVVADRKRQSRPTQLVVPTSVRVEAGWDRKAPGSAFINRLRIADASLDRTTADIAAGLGNRLGVSVADAHLGAVVELAAVDRVTVITSDPDDVRTMTAGKRITIVTI